MAIHPCDNYFEKQQEPDRSCMLAIRVLILNFDKNISEKLSYGMPTYYYNGKRFCYIWTSKKHPQPYIGFIDGKEIEHPKLLQENRSRMKIYLINPEEDLPIKEISELLEIAIENVKLK